MRHIPTRLAPWHEILKEERTKRGWSQQDVAKKIKGSDKSVGRWESGKVTPSPFYRQKLSELYGKSVEELGLAEEKDMPEVAQPIMQQENWGDAPDATYFYGYTQELDQIKRWITDERCRLVALLGMGGIGKTTLAIVAARQLQKEHPFEYIYWRSLYHAPTVESVLENCLQNLYAQRPVALPDKLDEQISLLITYLRQHRCLLILDNVESVLLPGQHAGIYIESDKGYGRLFQRIGEAEHDSCLMLTSREKPREIARLEGTHSPVRSLRLTGIEQTGGQALLRDEELSGSDEAQAELVERYRGNPLALKLVSEPIREVFGGDISAFLKEESSVFGEISDLLEQQFQRLSAAERNSIYWLAIEHESVPLATLQEDTQISLNRKVLVEALDALRRRSLIEEGREGHFMLQPVVMEYITEQFVERISEEIAGETFALLASHTLMKASAADYLRESQVHFILEPIIQKLHASFGRTRSEQKLKRMLSMLHTDSTLHHSYAAGNILNLLIHARADLRGLDFSHLTVRQADLQGVSLPEVNFASADLASCRFTDTFSNILCLAVSPDGTLLAGGTTTDEVRIWRAESATTLFRCTGHGDEIRTVAFSPDSKLFVSGSEDHTLRVWESATGRCLKSLQGHTDWILSTAFSSDGHTVASASLDQTVRLWDTDTGECLKVLCGHTGKVRAVAFSPGGKIIASGSEDCTIRLWNSNTGECLKVLHGHTSWVRTLAFSPGGEMLASGGEDKTARFWDMHTGECSRVLQGHTERVRTIAWTSDGTLLASAGDDHFIRLWDGSTGQCLKALQGHTNRIWSLVFLPASTILVSACEDDTMRFWDVHSGQCTRTLRGQTNLIKEVAFSPDGRKLVSGSEDQVVRLWDASTGQCLKSLREHENRVRCVTFSPDGASFASGSEDETIRLWDTHSGQVRKILRGHSHLVRSIDFRPDGKTLVSGSHDGTIRLWDVESGLGLKKIDARSLVWSVAFSPDGKTLASGNDVGVIQFWDVESGTCIKTLAGHTHRVWSVLFHPSGTKLVSSGDDQTIRIWDIESGACLITLQEHTSWVRSVAFSADGSVLASGSHDQTVRVWDTATGRCLTVLRGHTGYVYSVSFSLADNTLASAGDDGNIKLWNIQSGTCLKTLRAERLYEQMNLAGAKGLTDSQRASLLALGAVEIF
jgi:WD40 repeat protein/transcriptional regulator with XRE-family HTH domain